MFPLVLLMLDHAMQDYGHALPGGKRPFSTLVMPRMRDHLILFFIPSTVDLTLIFC